MAPYRRVVSRFLGTLAVLLTLLPSSASAVLKDRGPAGPIRYPLWYRDLNGVALDLCVGTFAGNLAIPASPNPDAAGAEMCLPPAPAPAAFAGNFGDEGFFFAADAALADPVSGFSARLTLALEAAYATGAPVAGEEIVFARERVLLEVPVAGVYTVTHPYGQRTFVVEQTGPRALFFTSDIGITNFDLPLGGAIGPFLEWERDPADPAAPYGRNADGTPLSLTVTDVLGSSQQFLGDPNIPHRVVGSPFGTNHFRVDGPPGSALGGPGVDFLVTDLFNMMGRRYLVPIANPLGIDHASYAVRADGLVQVQVGATALPAQELVTSAAGLPTLPMATDGAGRYGAHVALAAGSDVPSFVSVTNLSDVPPHSVTATLADVIDVTGATYDQATGILSVSATSSDTRPAGGPALSIVAPALGAMTPAGAGAFGYTTVAPPEAAIAPWRVTIQSSRGGSVTAPVSVFQATPRSALAPFASRDAFSVNESSPPPAAPTSTVLDVLANDADALGLPLVGATPVVFSPAAHGTLVVNLDGTITYRAAVNYNGPDSFTYAVQDASLAFSNVTTVDLAVVRVNDAPIGASDTASAWVNGAARTINVLANDVDVDGALDPASLTIVTPPASGVAVAGANGTVTFTPTGITTARTVTFRYTVADLEGAVSAPVTVTVVVFGQAERLATSRVQYSSSQRRWDIRGTSTHFAPGLANFVTISRSDGVLLGFAPIDATGSWVFAPAAGSVPAPDAARRVNVLSSGGGQLLGVAVSIR